MTANDSGRFRGGLRRLLPRRIHRPPTDAPPATPERIERVGLDDEWPVDTPLRDEGVNVVGYLHKQLALGDAGRRIADALRHASIPTSTLAFGASPSPPVDPPFAADDRIGHSTTLAVVAADQMPVLAEWHPELIEASGRMIGYCFWETSTLTEAGRRGLDVIDEVWAPTRFVEECFRREDRVPVHHVPLHIPEPQPSRRPRSSFAPLADATERLVIGVTFDHFSVIERKNPIASIRSFRQAFRDGEGPLLVVKTLNAELHPDEHRRVIDAAGGRSDIVVWDAHLSRPDQLAFLGQLDVLISLHRGEGLGLHLAEAMWLGVPCIATGYSGNLDFMDDDNARLVGYDLVDAATDNSIYPLGMRWADPDLDDATAALRELCDDDTRQQMGAAARLAMMATPDASEMAATMHELLTRGAG